MLDAARRLALVLVLTCAAAWAGAASPVAAQVSFGVVIDSGPERATTSRSAEFRFRIVGGSATFVRCLLDGRSVSNTVCRSPVRLDELAEGGHDFVVQAWRGIPEGPPDAAASYGWRVDLTAPNTGIVSGPPARSSSRSARFVMSSNDQDVAGFQCRVDAVTFASCASTHTVNDLAEGEHVFEARAVDAAGNVDPSPARHVWTVDVSAPQTRIDSGPSSPTNARTATLAFSSPSADVMRLECRLDAAAFASCASPHSLSGLAEGQHVLEVRAVDAAGNADPSPARHVWTVDVSAPQTRIDSGPASPTNARTATLAFSSPSPDAVRLECRLDAAAFAACTSPTTFSGLAAGEHSFEVRAVDAAGNADASPARHVWTVDVSTPQTRIDSGPPSPTNARTATLAFSSPSADVARLECRLDAAAFATCISPTTFSGLAAGEHSFEVRAVDSGGNVDPTPARWTWTIHEPTPDTFSLAGGSASSAIGSTQSVTATIMGADAMPVIAMPVSFRVIEGPHRGTATTIRTGGDGRATFTYTGTAIGTDSIQGSYQDAFGRTRVSDVVHRTWTAAIPPFADSDRDTIPDGTDNCSQVANTDQADRDRDAVGDACDLALPPGDLPVVVGEAARVKLVAGQVFVKLPKASRTTKHTGTSPGFVPLKGAATIPVGSEIDARQGSLELTTAATFKRGAAQPLQTARIAAALFKIRQARRAATRAPRRTPAKSANRPTVDFVLRTPPGRARACDGKLGPLKGAVRTLSGSGQGIYRTIGGASTTQVTNATWIVQDRCDGTLTQIGRGTARVYDAARRTTVLVRSGQAYLARARLFAAKRIKRQRTVRRGARTRPATHAPLRRS